MSCFKYLLLTLVIIFSPISLGDDLPNPDEDNLANTHLLDETCAGQCHQDEEPSEELTFEYNSCVECHDTFGELEGRQHNIKHQESEQMECVDCHLPHEEFDPKEMCLDCHDEGDEELEDFYSIRFDKYQDF
ncbi:MAG: cytochrome c3 family protein [Aliivibrio sp.]|uniref:cytochrome c3 family protein n=1 Tax=Aliivibrio sp. TaxID=1872443 RepID=UPI001A610772|nr:cytochrome c3 family protein [Aliivibrio sp.]